MKSLKYVHISNERNLKTFCSWTNSHWLHSCRVCLSYISYVLRYIQIWNVGTEEMLPRVIVKRSHLKLHLYRYARSALKRCDAAKIMCHPQLKQFKFKGRKKITTQPSASMYSPFFFFSLPGILSFFEKAHPEESGLPHNLNCWRPPLSIWPPPSFLNIPICSHLTMHSSNSMTSLWVTLKFCIKDMQFSRMSRLLIWKSPLRRLLEFFTGIIIPLLIRSSPAWHGIQNVLSVLWHYEFTVPLFEVLVKSLQQCTYIYNNIVRKIWKLFNENTGICCTFYLQKPLRENFSTV